MTIRSNISKIIYDNTIYHNGEYRYYPTITELDRIIKIIANSNSTTKYIRITPFYINAKHNRQIEFEDYMFYLECREQIDEEILVSHIFKCFDKDYSNITHEEIELGKVLYPLCSENDVEVFNLFIQKYRMFLDELLPRLLEFSKSKLVLKDEDLAFGYFCFEIHSE